MDADPPPRTSGSTLRVSVTLDGRSQPDIGLDDPDAARSDAGRDRDAEAAEDPYSPGSLIHSTAPLLGALIGLLTLIVPVASVLGSRIASPPLGSGVSGSSATSP